MFEAKKTATLKGGRSWINLDASGVAVGGARIMLGGGATGTARKAPSPQLPEVSPTYEDDFTIQWEERPKDLSPKERLLLCLPDIAAAEMERQTSKEDKQGWLYLREMLLRWFSSRTDTGIQPYGGSPFWIDWDWVMKYFRARYSYLSFIDPAYDENTPHYNSIYARAALEQLGVILCRENYLDPTKDVIEFDFIHSNWRRWEDLYHTLNSVPRGKLPDGLMAALAGFTLRTLAAGKAENLGNHRWRITVTDVSVFVHDKFNFDKESSLLAEFLGLWSCEELKGAMLLPLVRPWNFTRLMNDDFRAFREKRKHGVDFLVLSLPHKVENFRKTSYDILCTPKQ